MPWPRSDKVILKLTDEECYMKHLTDDLTRPPYVIEGSTMYEHFTFDAKPLLRACPETRESPALLEAAAISLASYGERTVELACARRAMSAIVYVKKCSREYVNAKTPEEVVTWKKRLTLAEEALQAALDEYEEVGRLPEVPFPSTEDEFNEQTALPTSPARR